MSHFRAARRLIPLLLLPLLPLLAGGCGEQGKVAPSEIRVLAGGNQCAMPGEAYPVPLLLQVAGRPAGFLGDPDSPPPAAGTPVRFEAVGDSDLAVSPREAVSDGGGLVRVAVTAGKKIGDHYLRVVPEEAPERAVTVRFVSGVKLGGIDQEGRAGTLLPEPLTVRVARSDGTPAAEVPVFFQFANPDAVHGARLTRHAVRTDEFGEARTDVILGNFTGSCAVNIEIAGDGEEIPAIRGIAVRELSYSFYRILVTILGGLAIFIFGMKLMSDGLDKAAGKRMRGILHFFAGNRYMAILAGAVVTAVIQSSSATTVMVIGFVNAGLLNLVQSIGIIFGASIGTTITAQIIAFDMSGIALPAIIVGMLLVFVTCRRLAGWGETILGFGLLFFGMTMMSSDLKLVSRFPSFIEFFQTFDCAPVGGWMPPGPLLGAIGIGVLVTIIIQSSSATTGIILALGGSGLINLYTAVALVMGCNVGTTITGLLAAIPTNRIAKQAAIAHTLFKIFGVVVIGASFYIRWGGSEVPIFFRLIDVITRGDAFAAIPQNMPRHIANAHTVFNILTTVILVPFINPLARLCTRILPAKAEADVFQRLEPHLLNTPEVALGQAADVLRDMVTEAWRMIEAATALFLAGEVDEEAFERLDEREKETDRTQAEITDYLVQLTRHELSQDQAEIVPLLMHCTNDAERIADHAENICQLTRRLARADKGLSKSARKELDTLSDKLTELAECVEHGFSRNAPDYLAPALAAEETINRLAEELESHHIQRLRKGKCSVATGVIFIELVGELEKVGDHLINIAERLPLIHQHYHEIFHVAHA